MNKREAELIARAVAIIDAGGNIQDAAWILRPLAGPKTLGVKFKPICRVTRPKAKRSKPRRGRVHDRDYLAWIRTWDCIVCHLKVWGWAFMLSRREDGIVMSEAAHVGIRGLGQKCSDRETVPLCKQHHTEGKESERTLGKRFWSFHGLDKAEVIKALNAEYERRAA